MIRTTRTSWASHRVEAGLFVSLALTILVAGQAIVYPAMLVVFMMLILILIQALVGERRIGRRIETPPIDAPALALAQG